MGDASIASTDSDNSLLSPADNSKISCSSAATQTPKMSRHVTSDVTAPSKDMSQHVPLPSTSAITVYKLDPQKPLSELEQDAKTLSIPDVVVEYIKDSLTLQDDPSLGTSNPAFDAGEVIIVRTQSGVNLQGMDAKEGVKPLSPLSPEHKRLYCSMPRTSQHSPSVACDKMVTGSQPSTPKMGRLLGVVDPSLSASTSSLGYPRSIPPSPNFGYRSLESETSAVYTIIAPVKYMVNGKDSEMKYNLEREQSFRKFEYNPAPTTVERRRRRLQCCTDICSILFLIPGLFIAIFTPVTLIPMFMMPLDQYITMILVFVTSGTISVVVLAFSGLIGNMIWHYDPDKKRLRLRMHCGSGPRLHFWGNGLLSGKEDLQPLKKEQIV